MSSSTMRKLGQRSTHKERAQPLERQKLGLLEKHKDYSLRAKDFNKKKAYLKTLRQKAAERNEDEFYHKMLSRRGPGSAATRSKGAFTGTADGDRGNKALSVDVVRLLKTQDQGYLRTMRNVLAKEVKELEQQLAITVSFAGAQQQDVADMTLADSDEDEDGTRRKKRRKPNKIVFSNDTDERDATMAEDDSTIEADSSRAANGSDDGFGGFDDDDEAGRDAPEDDAKADKVVSLSRKLKNARRRLKALTEAENELELQRARMAKTATVGGVSKSGKKIKIRERKR